MNKNGFVTTNEVVNSLNKLIHGTDESAKTDYINVYKLAYCNAGIPLPEEFLNASNNSERLKVIRDAFTNRQRVEDDELIKSINHALAKMNADERKDMIRGVRGLLLDGEIITDSGIRCDEDGNDAENPDFTIKTGSDVLPWQTIKYRHNKTGEEIKSDKYNTLSHTERQNYKPIRVMYPSLPGDYMPDIDQNDRAWLAAGIKQDIMLNPGIVWRYISETGAPHPGNPDGGCLYEYRNVVAEAMNMLPSLEFSAGTSLTDMVTSGAAKNWWHIQIIVLLTIYYNFDEEDISNKSSDEDIMRYLDLVEIFSNPASTITLSDDDLKSFRAPNGESLPGLDQKGVRIDNEDIVTLSQQRDFLRYTGEELLIRIQNVIINSNDPRAVRANPIAKRAGNLYSTIICNG